jgi:hypothetical protein
MRQLDAPKRGWTTLRLPPPLALHWFLRLVPAYMDTKGLLQSSTHAQMHQESQIRLGLHSRIADAAIWGYQRNQ